MDVEDLDDAPLVVTGRGLDNFKDISNMSRDVPKADVIRVRPRRVLNIKDTGVRGE